MVTGLSQLSMCYCLCDKLWPALPTHERREHAPEDRDQTRLSSPHQHLEEVRRHRHGAVANNLVGHHPLPVFLPPGQV